MCVGSPLVWPKKLKPLNSWHLDSRWGNCQNSFGKLDGFQSLLLGQTINMPAKIDRYDVYIYICNKFKYKHYQHSSPTSLAPWPSTTCSPSVSSQQHQEVPSTSGVCPQQFSMLKMGGSPTWLAMLRWNQKMDSSSSRGINLSHSKSRKIQKMQKRQEYLKYLT